MQTGRKRKTPYRDCFNGLNGYNPYTALNGYPATCPQTGEIKTDISTMYPYTGNNYGLETSDLYRTSGYTYSGLYGTTDTYRLEAEKAAAAYPNGYYLQPREYQHTLQYHGNGYTDLMAQTSKYSYDMSKYGYDTHHVSSYGLDLSKRPYDDMDLHTYSSAADKLSRVNGYDPLKTSALYGTTPILNNDSMSHLTNTSATAAAAPCTLYGSTTDRYGQDATKDLKLSRLPTSPLQDNSSGTAVLPNGHASVIRNASPRTRSPRPDQQPTSSVPSTYNSAYSSYPSSGVSVLSSCGNPSTGAGATAGSSWQACNKAPTPKQGSPVGTPTTPHDPSAIGSQGTLPSADMGSRIMSPKQDGSTAVSLNTMATPQANSSPASATTATSVIQSGRNR